MTSAEHHDREARKGMAEARAAVWAEPEEFWAPGIAQCYVHLFRPLVDAGPRAKILDYGCGIGRLMYPLVHRQVGHRDAELDVCGYDPSEAMIARAAEHLGAGTYRLRTDPPDEHFDLIYSVAVLQHLDPAEQDRALRWMAEHADTVVVQYVTHPAEVGPLSHPTDSWLVLRALDAPRRHATSVEFITDDRFPTWRWATASYR